MTRYELINALLHFLVFFVGAGIGSFLNVVIYRVPLGISVNKPRRSFCPTCKKQIPFWLNIPLFSWLALRGKCADCDAKISFRYFAVELLVGLLFYIIFKSYGGPWEATVEWGPRVLGLWVFVSLLVAGSFIDIEHLILPLRITLGGTVAGLLFSMWAPSLVGESVWYRGLMISAMSGAIGLGGLWMVVELGKLAFGRLKFDFEEPVPWSVTQPDENEPPVVKVGDETHQWVDLFGRNSDRLLIDCTEVTVNDRSWKGVKTELWMEQFKVHDGKGVEVLPLEDVKVLKGETSKIVIPREAMGFGDVLLLMMIGSFIGWQAVLFTILAASVIGTLVAVVQRVFGGESWGARIPFGPYLALGALLWIFVGPLCVHWYLERVGLI